MSFRCVILVNLHTGNQNFVTIVPGLNTIYVYNYQRYKAFNKDVVRGEERALGLPG